MTFLTRVDRQFMLRNWISRNLKPIKRFNMYYGDSRTLLRLAKENDERLADIGGAGIATIGAGLGIGKIGSSAMDGQWQKSIPGSKRSKGTGVKNQRTA